MIFSVVSQFLLWYTNFFIDALSITLVPSQTAETMYNLHAPGCFRWNLSFEVTPRDGACVVRRFASDFLFFEILWGALPTFGSPMSSGMPKFERSGIWKSVFALKPSTFVLLTIVVDLSEVNFYVLTTRSGVLTVCRWSARIKKWSSSNTWILVASSVAKFIISWTGIIDYEMI